MQDFVPFPLEQADLTLDLHGGLLRRTVHPSGLRILTEQMPGARSASIGFWVGVGSRDEQADRSDAPGSLGSTHFLEHLLFKGTSKLNAYEIARAFDKMGADHNALTAKEYTSYYAKVRDVHIAEATALLAQMVTDSVIDEGEFETERGVILEELAMAEDDLGDVAGERFFEAVMGEHPLGRPIGGNNETIAKAARDDVLRHYFENYRANTLVVTAAGAIEHEAFVELVVNAIQEARSERFSTGTIAKPAARRARDETPLSGIKKADPLLLKIQKPSEQVHLMRGTRGLRVGAENRYAFGVMNSVLGGGMSSRLFQEIREKRGLAYTTYSFGASYSDAGLFAMYAACLPRKARDVSNLMADELAKIASEGVTEEEFERTIGQISGSSALALEDSDTRMGRLARTELGTGEFIDLDASIERFERVTNSDIKTVANDLLNRSEHLVLVGDAAKTDL